MYLVETVSKQCGIKLQAAVPQMPPHPITVVIGSVSMDGVYHVQGHK